MNLERFTPEETSALIQAAQTSPLAFTAFWFSALQGGKFITNWHHHYFKWAAQQLLEGKAQNIIINVPPGSTKTEFWSVHLPAYCFANYDNVRILNTSYSKDLVNENSERTRELVKSAEFSEFYGLTTGKDKVDDWTLEKNGKRVHQLFSRSAGGQITGVRGGYMHEGFSGYISADDWEKPDDVFSKVKRDKSHMRLSNTLRSRRATSDTPFIFIQQRLHTEDGTGFLLTGGMGLKVDLHIKIPALIDLDYINTLPTEELKKRALDSVKESKQVDGKWSYWPRKVSIDDLLDLRDSDPYTFASQEMQEPRSLGNSIFDTNAFLYYSEDEDEDNGVLPKPEFEYRFITADTAQKTAEHNDFTVFAEWGVYQGRVYRLSYFRGKIDAKRLRAEFESFVKAAWAKNRGSEGNLRAVYVEDKSSGTGLIQETAASLPIKITPIQRNTDKFTRAMDVQPHVNSGKVVLPYGDRYNYEFLQEVGDFNEYDTHKHDDQTDVMMDAVNEAIIKPKIKKKSFYSKRR